MKLFILEIKNLVIILFILRPAQRRLVFFNEKSSYFPIFKGLIEYQLRRGVGISYVAMRENDPGLEMRHQNLSVFYLNTLVPSLFRLIDCKVLVTSTTELNTGVLKKSNFPVHYVYLFHSLASTHMAFPKGSFDEYDTLFCPGPRQKMELEKMSKLYDLPERNLVEIGDFRLDELADKFTHYVKKNGTSKEIRNILISPSWAEDNLVNEEYFELYRVLVEKGYNLTFKPHSEIIKRTPDKLKRLETEFQLFENFNVVIEDRGGDLLYKSDTLITDYSGISFSFAFGTLRPVLFIDTKPKVRNEFYKELEIEPLEISLRGKIGSIISKSSFKSIPRIIDDFQNNSEEYKKKIAKVRDQYISNFGKSEEAANKALSELLP